MRLAPREAGFKMELAPLSIQLLGAFEVRVGGAAMRSVRTRSVEWLLALLVLRHGRELSRSWLAGTLWPESREAQALFNLRRNLMDLRQALGPEAERLRSPSRGSLLLDLTGATVDVLDFDAAVAAGDEGSLERAVALYRGPLLEGCVEEWVFPERASRAEACLQALETLADRALERGDPASALGHLLRAEALDPLRDSVQQRRIQALAAAGDLPAALLSYRDYRLLLHRELNSEPDPETTRLFQELRSGGHRPTLRRPSAPDLTAGTCPPSAPLQSLPCPLTAFIGREQELQEVARLVTSARLITLVGGGGVGKTRLALEVAAQVSDAFPGGAAWVELASLADGALVLPSVAAALGVHQDAGGGDADTLAGRLFAPLSEERPLLVLDNCEHVLDAAAALVQMLLQRCPELRVLATSRQRLGLPGEIVWRVPSLSTPDPEQLPSASEDAIAEVLRFPAVRLFVERAASAHPGFRLRSGAEAAAVGLICRRLDGIPLALELAAPRARALTLQQIAERLDDRFRLLTSGSRAALPRHQTLRALIDWSYDSLPEAEATLLRRLSVFAGGWTLEAAEAICFDLGWGDEPEAIQNPKSKIQNTDVLDLLDALVDRSLVLVDEVAEGFRYRMLETVREYAGEKLAGSGERAAVRDRHRDWWLELAGRSDSVAQNPEQTAQQTRLAAELDNLRAALTWCQEAAEANPASDAAEVGLRLAAALSWVWARSRYVMEGLEWLEGALARSSEVPAAVRAHGFVRAATLAWTSRKSESTMSFYQSARHEYEEALALAHAEGDSRGIAAAALGLAQVTVPLGDLDAAWSYAVEARQRMAELGDRAGLVGSLEALREVASARRDPQAARSLLERTWSYFAEAQQQMREQGDPVKLAGFLEAQARLALQRGDHRAARPLLEERLAICQELGESDLLIHALGAMGHLERDEGDYARARALYRESLLLRQKVGHQGALAQSLEDLAVLASRERQVERAIRLLGAAEAYCETLGAQPPVASREEYERTVTEGRAALGEAPFAAAWAEGRAMSLELAVEDALGAPQDPPPAA
jgi:predicted ATPase/DNA-binding SARP family transcriptional activator